MVSDQEKKIIRALQEGIPLVSRPYKVIAEKIGVSEESLIVKINEMKERGLIRRIGAAVRHQDLGYSANAMVVWNVPPDSVQKTGELFSGFPEVSHCYERSITENWKYNMFTMVHGKSVEECNQTAKTMSKASGLNDYMVLFSTEELKKDSMKYFV
ncbi:MAG: Lrp/AsnC family transcriptional regulator [Bacillota bacterium]